MINSDIPTRLALHVSSSAPSTVKSYTQHMVVKLIERRKPAIFPLKKRFSGKKMEE